MTDDKAPPKPSRLSLWMSGHGRPSQLRVEYRPTGVDTAETVVILTVTDYSEKKGASIEVSPGEIGRERYGSNNDVFLHIDHAFIVDWTDQGRKRLDEWLSFNKRNARELAEFERLKKKFQLQS